MLNKNSSGGLFFIVLLLFSLMSLAPIASAIQIGATPTPVPTTIATPTPQIIYVTVTPEPTPTVNITVYNGTSSSTGGMEIHTVQKIDNQEGVLFVARGDETIISGTWNRETNYNKLMQFWLFGTYSSLDYIYAQPLTVDTQDIYHVYLTAEQTSGLKTGKYIGLIQSSGRDGRLISYDKRNEELVSPFRDIEPVSILGDTPGGVYQKLIAMLSNETFNDDTYRLYDIRVEDPWVGINQNYGDGDPYDPKLYISGETNLGSLNALTITLDVEKQTNKKMLEEATKVLKIYPYTDPMHPRNTWNFSFQTAGLYPGKHSLLIKSPRFGTQTSTVFDLSEAWQTPTPIPTPQRVLGFPSPTITPTPIITFTVVPTVGLATTVIPTNQSYAVVEGETWTLSPTVPPAPEITTEATATPAKRGFLGAKADSPVNKSLSSMPVGVEIPLFSVIVGLLLIARRAREDQ